MTYQLSPLPTVAVDEHEGAVFAGVAPAGTQSSSPGWRTVAAEASLAARSALVSSPALDAIPNQLSPATTVCSPAHDFDRGADAGVPAGRQTESPACSTVLRVAVFSTSRADTGDADVPCDPEPAVTVADRVRRR
jgi:hypothetical protein